MHCSINEQVMGRCYLNACFTLQSLASISNRTLGEYTVRTVVQASANITYTYNNGDLERVGSDRSKQYMHNGLMLIGQDWKCAWA